MAAAGRLKTGPTRAGDTEGPGKDRIEGAAKQAKRRQGRRRRSGGRCQAGGEGEADQKGSLQNAVGGPKYTLRKA
jgi:hypothetical protein